MKAVTAIVLVGLLACVQAQSKLKVCSTHSNYNDCQTLQRGNSEVSCQFAQDDIECAKRIQNGTADFGVISAESAVQMSVLEWDDIAVVKQLRHKDVPNQEYDFASVVVVRKDITSFESLRNKRFCHPGLVYTSGHKWSEYFLKYFERNVSLPNCQSDMSAAEIEVSSLSKFFDRSCRPGTWSFDPEEDAKLKKKYSTLCGICSSNCDYAKSANTLGEGLGHGQALNCLYKDGDVTYVSKYDAVKFFKDGNGDDFRYLCPNKTIQTVVNNENPCVWLTQPWKPVISSYKNKENIETKLNLLENDRSTEWKQAVFNILAGNQYILKSVYKDIVKNYVQTRRETPKADTYCNTEISWCTRNVDEKEECDVIRAATISTGIFPIISCHDPVKNGTIECMSNINKNTSKFMGIDSNFGYIARDIFNLKSALYFETEESQYSRAVVAVRAGSKYTSLKSLKGAQACLPEFGGTTSVAFVNVGKQQGFLTKKECRYGKILENFFGPSCAPGSQDAKHFFTGNNAPANLCGLCVKTELNHPYVNITDANQNQNTNPTCDAHESNRYYGNAGALRCLQEQGDVAILEHQDLSNHAINLNINENDFRVICRNGSLARDTGFHVDDDCMLTTIVDGEIVVRRGSKHEGVVHTLAALDRYFRSEPNFQMYNIFNGKKNLLFKDSTIGLIPAESVQKGKYVQNYVNLFQDIDKCNGASALQISAITAFLLAFVSRFF